MTENIILINFINVKLYYGTFSCFYKQSTYYITVIIIHIFIIIFNIYK